MSRVDSNTYLRSPRSSLAIALLTVPLLSGCGGGSTQPPPPPPAPTITSVTVSPTGGTLPVKATQQFNANVEGTGTFNAAVNWFVNDEQGGNTTVGTITNTGLYTVPITVPSPSNVTVKAKSVQDSTKFGTAQLTIVLENVKIDISPSSGSTQLGGTLQFTANVTGTANTGVTWSVNNLQGGQASIGTINSTGLYTAPVNLPAHSTVSIVATSQEDVTKQAAAAVTILATAAGITVTVTPQNPSVPFDGSKSIQFAAAVSGTSNSGVTWSVDTSNGAIGQISNTGLFTPFGFNCSNVPVSGAIRAVSVANPGAQGVSVVNLAPPTPAITGISPQPADAQSTVQITGTFAVGAALIVDYPGPNGTSIPGTVSTVSGNSISSAVPLGASTGSLSVQQTCTGSETGAQFASQQSNSLPFVRLPRVHIRAHRQVLTTGESTQMVAAFFGDATPKPLTWTALFGKVSGSGVFTAGSGTWDKVTACISGTQQCDFYVFSIVSARIEPTVPVVSMGETLQLSAVQGTTTLTPTWTVGAGGGTVNPSGIYTAPITFPDSGPVSITGASVGGNVGTVLAVTGGFPGMVNRIIDFPDVSATATSKTSLPKSIAVDGNRVYVLNDNLPFNIADGHYNWIDAYDATDPAHPSWTGAVEGLDQDTNIQPMEIHASGSHLWRVSIASETGIVPGTPEVAFYDASTGSPMLTQFYTTPVMCSDNFYQGLFIGIPCSFNPNGQSIWQSPVTAMLFDGRTGTLIPSQLHLPLPGGTPASITGIAITDTRLFLLLYQQQNDGSMPLFLSTYDLGSSPPTLLQTVSAQPGPVVNIGGTPPAVYGNLLFAGAGVYDISSGLPVYREALQGPPPVDMNGSIALFGPFPDDRYRLIDYSVPNSPMVTTALYNGDTMQGPVYLVGQHAYLIGSGVQIHDVSAVGGPLPEPQILGNGILAAINDLFVDSSTLYAAENSDAGTFVTSFDISQTQPTRISSFSLNKDTPLSFAKNGHFLFVGTDSQLLVLDVSNPSAPSKVTSLPLPTSSLALAGNFLFAGTTDNRLIVVDVTNPASPVSGNTTKLAGFPVRMRVSGGNLFIAADTAGLLTFSIASPSTPILVSQFQPSSAVVGVDVDGNLALLAAADGGFMIANVANPAIPVLAGQASLDLMTCYSDLDPDNPPAIVSVAAKDGIAYVGSFSMSGRVFGFDYHNPTQPRLVSAAPYGSSIDESMLTFAFSGSRMFLAGDFSLNTTDSIFVADITQPRNFIRKMCSPPPFGTKAGAVFPQVKINGSGKSVWNPKTKLTMLKSR